MKWREGVSVSRIAVGVRMLAKMAKIRQYSVRALSSNSSFACVAFVNGVSGLK